LQAVVAGAAAAPALGDDPKKEPTKPQPAARPEPAHVEAPPPLDEVDARMALVLARYGKHAKLDDKARATIRSEIAGIVRRGEALRKITLTNGDGPFPVFHPYRAPLAVPDGPAHVNRDHA
jgi:hypothetical protein